MATLSKISELLKMWHLVAALVVLTGSAFLAYGRLDERVSAQEKGRGELREDVKAMKDEMVHRFDRLEDRLKK